MDQGRMEKLQVEIEGINLVAVVSTCGSSCGSFKELERLERASA